VTAYDLRDTFTALRTAMLVGTAGTTFGQRVYLALAPARTEAPYVQVQLVTLDAERTFDQEGYSSTVQLSAYFPLSTGPAAAAAGAAALRANVGKTKLTIAGQTNLTCHAARERGPFRDSDLWRVDIDLTIRSLET